MGTSSISHRQLLPGSCARLPLPSFRFELTSTSREYHSMRIFRLIVLTSIATLVLEISSATPAQQPHFTSEQVMHAVQEVEKLAQKQIDQNAVPGLAIAVVFQHKVVYAKGFEVLGANTKAFKRVSTP